MQHGFIDLTWDEYNAIDAVRSSWLKAMKRSPAACKLAMGDDTVDTKALRMGRALHSVVLEPLAGNVIRKDWDGRTKEGKKQAADVPKGAIVLAQDEYSAVYGMAASIRTHPTISKMIAKATFMEQSVLWERSGRLCKAQIDLGTDHWIADVKSTTDVRKFSPYAVTEYSYHCQAAWYLSGYSFLGITPPEHFYFFVVANTAPYESSVFRLDAESLGQGVDETSKLFDQFLQCEKDDKWTRHETFLRVARTFPPREEQTNTLLSV